MVSQPPALNAQSDDSSSNRPSSLLTHQSCLQKVEVIELEKGKRKYRLTGMRIGLKNNLDVIDRNVPFVDKIISSGTQLTHDIVYWCFTSSFWKFAFLSIVIFSTLCVIFTFLILAFVARAPTCLSPSLEGLPFRDQFNDALQLSWTTFTTVGYGYIAPSTGGHGEFLDDPAFFKEEGLCLLVNFLLSFESLVGVLFVGFCSAILFGKLTSFQNNAKVVFSDVMVITFGEKGISHGDSDDDDDSDDEDGHKEQDPQVPRTEKINCPTIRFRIVNQLHANRSGEIIDANLNAVATIDAKDSILGVGGEKVFRNAMQKVSSENERIHFGQGVVGVLKKGAHVTKTATHGVKNVAIKSANMTKTLTKKQAEKVNNSIHRVKQFTKMKGMPSLAVDSTHSTTSTSDIDAGLLAEMVNNNFMFQEETNMDQPNLVYANIEISPASHPFFRSTWLVNHTLDVTSPLLTRSVRKKVAANGGYWPEELNNVEGVKKSIHFDQLLVSISGQSKVAGSTVYEQQIYTLDDLKIGCEFKSVLMQNPDNSIFVRVGDVNMIQKQKYEQTKDVCALRSSSAKRYEEKVA